MPLKLEFERMANARYLLKRRASYPQLLKHFKINNTN